MSAYLEIVGVCGRQVLVLEGKRLTIGKSEGNDLSLPADRTVSGLHAVLGRFPTGWSIRDMTSLNGTFVNGQRILTERALHPGDEIGIGSIRLVYRVQGSSERTVTQTAQAPPELTRREREVLLALCRPVLLGDVFTEPASVTQMAEELVVTEAAVKQHLMHLYDKFGLAEGAGRRRVHLANQAVRRGAVRLADLRSGRATADSD